MQVDYLEHMGSDLSIVDRARISFAKRSKWGPDGKLIDKDVRLIKYLATHKHMLPFRHPQVSFHFKAPIFVARQLVKHQVGMSWSEISRRYVTGEPELWWPAVWREAAADKKQGSLVTGIIEQRDAEAEAKFAAGVALKTYNRLLGRGVAPEQARMILPLNMMTEWHWTGSLLAWAHLWNLRTEEHAQQECQDCVRLIGPKMVELFPVSWKVLTSARTD